MHIKRKHKLVFLVGLDEKVALMNGEWTTIDCWTFQTQAITNTELCSVKLPSDVV